MATEIKGSQIRDETVTAADLGPNSVSSSELAPGSISGQDLTTTTDATNDRLLIWDATDSALKQVAPTDLGIGGGGDSDMIEDADHNTKIEVEANANENKIRLTTNGVERMIIDENGKVGIGRTPTVGILEVNGEVLMSGGTLSTETVDVSKSIGGHINLIRDVGSITDGSTLGMIQFAGTEDTGSSFGEGAWIASHASENWNVGFAEGANLRFYTQINGGNAGPDERMRIDNTGKVGIGVSAPQSLLHLEHIDDTPWPTNSSSDEEYSNFLLTLRNNTNTEDAFAGIAFDISTETDADSIGAAIAAHCSNTNSALHDTCLVFATNDAGDDGLTERMRIMPDGKVGIGKEDPSYALDVGGDIGVDEYIYHNDDPDTYIRFQTDNINIQAGGKSMIKIDEGNGLVTINNANNDVDFQVLGVDGTSIIRTDATNNRVGIGITTPQSLLHLEEVDITTWPYGGVSNEFYNDFLLTLRNNTNTLDAFAGIAFDVSTETDSDSIGAAIVATCASTTSGQHDSDLVFATNNGGDAALTERVRIKAAGRIGFGTEDPESGIDATYAMYANHSDSYCLKLHNDGNSSSRRGLYVACGTDTGSGTNYGAVFADGNGTWQGSIKFTSGTVTYAAFTGDHPAEIPSGHSYDYGTIVCVTSTISTERSVVYNVTESVSEMQKSILGCYSGDNGGIEGPPARHSVYSVGDGHILVCSEGGNIEIGDFICTSNTAGHGMRQASENMTNYTIAKAFESVDWAQELQTTKLIACTYHAG